MRLLFLCLGCIFVGTAAAYAEDNLKGVKKIVSKQANFEAGVKASAQTLEIREYDRNGNVVFETRSDGTTLSSKYNETGQKVLERTFSAADKEKPVGEKHFEYSGNRLVSVRTIYESQNFDSTEPITYDDLNRPLIEFEDNLKWTVTYDSNGGYTKFGQWDTYDHLATYNSKNQLLHWITKQTSGDLTDEDIQDFEYDSKGRRVRELSQTSYNNGKEEILSSYDSRGNLNKEVHKDLVKNTTETYFVEYKYDSHGNWTEDLVSKKTGQEAPVPVFERTRDFEYFGDEDASAETQNVEDSTASLKIRFAQDAIVVFNGQSKSVSAGSVVSFTDVKPGKYPITVVYGDGHTQSKTVTTIADESIEVAFDSTKDSSVDRQRAQVAPRPVKTTYQLGDPGPAGGIIGSVDGDSYLEAAPQDLNSANWQDADEKSRAYRFGGFDDWRLPTQEELEKLYANLKKQGKGGFGTSTYWSSSESAKKGGHWGVFFFDGSLVSISFMNPSAIRPVRSFSTTNHD